jgi:hypothetical protein
MVTLLYNYITTTWVKISTNNICFFNVCSFKQCQEIIWVPDPCSFRVLDCSTNVSGTQFQVKLLIYIFSCATFCHATLVGVFTDFHDSDEYYNDDNSRGVLRVTWCIKSIFSNQFSIFTVNLKDFSPRARDVLKDPWVLTWVCGSLSAVAQVHGSSNADFQG